MAEDFSKTNSAYLNLVKEIENEIFSVSKNIEILNDSELTDNTYIYYSRQLDHIQNLFDRSSVFAKQLTLDQTNPDLYNVLEAKKALSDNYGLFHRLRSAFSKRYEKLHGKESERDHELTRERPFGSHGVEDDSEVEPEEAELTDEEPDFDEAELEAILAEEEEKEAKRLEKKERQKRLAEEARKKDRQRDEYNKRQESESNSYHGDRSPSDDVQRNRLHLEEEQYYRQRHADQMAMQHGEGQQISEAELRNERLRQDDERLQAEREHEERIQHENEVFQKYTQRMEESRSFEGLGTGHIDYSKDPGNPAESYVPVGYSPFGAIPLYETYNYENSAASNNSEIYSSIKNNNPVNVDAGYHIPLVSPVYDQQMRYNVESARMDYEAARGTADEREAANRYFEQREAFLQFRNDVRDGRIEVSDADPRRDHSYDHGFSKESYKPQQYEYLHPSHPEENFRDSRSFEPYHQPASHSHSYEHKEFSREMRQQEHSHDNRSFEPYVQPQPGYRSHESKPSDFSHDSFSPSHSHEERPVESFHSSHSRIYPYESKISDVIRGSGRPDVSNESRSFESFRQPRAQGTGYDSRSPVSSHEYESRSFESPRQSRTQGTGSDSRSPVSFHEYESRSFEPPRQSRSQGMGHDSRFPVSSHEHGTQDYKHEIGQSKFIRKSGQQAFTRDNQSVFTCYTPYGVSGKTISNGVLTDNSFSFKNPGLRDNTFHSAESPMRVHPIYEQQLVDRKNNATEVLNKYLAKGEHKNIPPAVSSEIKLATEAYLGYKNAKNFGSVIVTEDGKKSVPDFELWQKRHQAQGTTAQTRQNQNRPEKAHIEEVSSNIFGHNSKLKRESVAKQYFKSAGYRLSDYHSMASIMMRRRVMQLLQDGDDNPIRTLETGRYYLATSAAVGMAVFRAAPVSSMAHAAGSFGRKEYWRFGNLTQTNSKTLSGMIDTHKHLGSDIKKEMKRLIGKGTSMTGEDREYLIELYKWRHDNNKVLRHEIGMQRLRHNHDVSLSMAKELKREHKGFVTIKHVDQKMMQVRSEANKLMSKKFGALTNVTDASLAKEIAALKKQGQQLKAQIKVLKIKGNALTASEAKRLKALTAQHQKVNVQLRKLFGLKKSRSLLNEKLEALGGLRKSLAENASARRGGIFALQGIVLRPLLEGDSIGAQGLGKGVRVVTNPYVRRFVKNGMKLSMKTARFTSRAVLDLVAPGTTRAIDTSVLLTKQFVGAKVAAGKQAIKTGVKRTLVATKRGIGHLVPNKIKTAANRTANSVRTAKKGVQGMFAAGKQWFANTRVFQAASKVYNGYSKLMAGVKVVFGFIKAALMKILLVVALFILLCAILSVILTTFTGTTMSTIIMSPYPAVDGKISLKPYVEILDAKQAEFDAQITALKSNPKYENVYVQPASSTLNNYQEILSMMGVYYGDNLYLELNPLLQPFLEDLFDISHAFTKEEIHRECNPGCKEEIVFVYATDQNGNNVPVYKKDENGDFILDADGKKIQETSVRRYCPGHLDLHVKTYVLSFDELFDAASLGANYVINYGTGTFSDTLGGVSAKYEAGGVNPGSISTSSGLGGKGYGTWQITVSSSHTTMNNFISSTSSNSKIYNRLKNLTPGSEEFDEAWQACAREYHDEFQQLQAAFIYETHVKTFISQAKNKYGVDLNRCRALQEMAFSTAVQFGPYGTYALGNINSDMSDEEIIRTCYAAKRANVDSWFSSASESVRTSLKNNRFKNEEQDILSLIGAEDKVEISAENANVFWMEEEHREWARLIYEQDWESIYDVSFAKSSGAIINPMLDAEADEIIAACKAEYPELSAEREESIRIALSIVGRVQYYWGGGHEGSLEPGWNDKWGTKAPASSSGTTTYYTWGLDCSGFIRWIFLTQYERDMQNSTAQGIRDMNNAISRSEALPGDLANVPGSSKDVHIGMYLYTKEDGTRVFVHSGGGKRGVQLTTEAYGFELYHRPYFYDE